MSARCWIVAGSLLAAAAVAAGAFGAHGLRQPLPSGPVSVEQLAAYERAAAKLAIYDTAARYQMYHAIGLVLAGLLVVAAPRPGTRQWRPHLAGLCFAVGAVCFCGWLYADALLPTTPPLPLLAPLGGLLFMVGWLLLAAAGLARRRE